ncbi:organic cation transporter protein-like isoform X2 [Chrysoperla carnea]|uniref:organic cation transporter protein-like isoform X2 n=1 Tax=Chrysoperla carnea TaxID=189513 RepID=UPI001D0655D4|nr:organic cation transporter protein-like isoform X2 [Chrysoperla carnea]
MSDLKKHGAADIDEILKQLGLFGIYQKKRWILFVITIWALAMVEFTYIFTTTEYKPIWLNNAVPYKDIQPARCKRFQVKNETEQSSLGECDSELFNINVIEDCDEFVFDTKHTLIVQDFKLLCDKVWMIGIPGTAHSSALFVSLPISGYIADRVGRKKVIIFGLLLAGIFNIIKSFSVSFWMFVACEFLQAGSASGVFPSIFTLIAEFSPAERRVFGGVISFLCVAVAEVSIASIAWNIYSWRWFLRFATIPCALIILFTPFLPESIRWLISKNRIGEANTILETIAKANGTKLTEKHQLQLKDSQGDSKGDNGESESLKDVFKSVPMILRLGTCAFCWITCAFVFHGLLFMAGEISGNRYLNFILVGLVEIPGSCISYVSCRRFGRKFTISVALIVVGICCGSYIFIPDGHWLRLAMFLLGKCAITTAFGSLYIITAEIYPTPFRQTLMGICSMLGRIGSMSAPQMPVLATIWSTLPILIFSLISIMAGLLSLILPETLNTTLPDTIEEAININKKTVENTKL